MSRILRPLEGLEEVLAYEPDTGLLRWKVFIYRVKKPGDIAGSMNKKGYIEVRYKNLTYNAHRVCWYLYTGSDPGDNHIDHKDGNRANNKIDNLRLCNSKQNSANTNKKKNTTSKYKGVSFYKRHNKWQSSIRIANKYQHLGYYDTELKAHKAYCMAAFAEHGEFANFGENSPFKTQDMQHSCTPETWYRHHPNRKYVTSNPPEAR